MTTYQIGGTPMRYNAALRGQIVDALRAGFGEASAVTTKPMRGRRRGTIVSVEGFGDFEVTPTGLRFPNSCPAEIVAAIDLDLRAILCDHDKSKGGAAKTLALSLLAALALAAPAAAGTKVCYQVKCGPGKAQCVRVIVPCPCHK